MIIAVVGIWTPMSRFLFSWWVVYKVRFLDTSIVSLVYVTKYPILGPLEIPHRRLHECRDCQGKTWCSKGFVWAHLEYIKVEGGRWLYLKVTWDNGLPRGSLAINGLCIKLLYRKRDDLRAPQGAHVRFCYSPLKGGKRRTELTKYLAVRPIYMSIAIGAISPFLLGLYSPPYSWRPTYA